MADQKRCSTCGADLAPEGPAPQICVACAFGFALGERGIETPHLPHGAGVERIGPYRLLRVLGEGGMGQVWEAIQDEPVRRRVAIKRIKLGMDSAQVLARFESERQALALMSHPHIAQVFDAGCTLQGHPYFAMEYVEGAWLTRHCDAHSLTVPQRLEFFLMICGAIQHAHHKGVIHRDIKPSNILVQTDEGRPIPKVIDFGVAKAIGAHLTEKTLVTQIGQALGTLEYMSPEQAGPAGFDVDTRADVYSLGAVLYELLTGRLPFEAVDGDHDELRRRIREEEARPPSARVAGPGRPSEEIARSRGTDPAGLARRLRGDLDWITLKALAKDRSRRYGSPDDLAADLRRHLARQPVLAGPPSVVYRLSKFVRRHTLAVAAGSAIVLLLLTTAVGMTIQAGRVARERDRANKEAQTAGAALEFLTNTFRLSDPEQARGESITAREILDRGAADIERELQGAPEVQAELTLTIARSYKNLGLYDRAEPLARRAVGLYEKTAGADSPTARAAVIELADVLRRRESLEEAEGLARASLRSLEAIGGAEEQAAAARLALGDILIDRGQYEEAETHLRSAFETQTRIFGPDDRRTLQAAFLLGVCVTQRGRYDEADRLLRDVLERERRLFGGDHPDTISIIANLAVNSGRAGRMPEAVEHHREALAVSRRVLGDDHQETYMLAINLGRELVDLGRYAEAEPLIREGLEGNKRLLGPRSSVTLGALGVWGGLLQFDRGRLPEAEKVFQEVLEGYRETLGDEHPYTISAYNNLGQVQQARGRFEAAQQNLRIALEKATRVYGPQHPATIAFMANLGDTLAASGDRTQALRWLTEALEAARKALPEKHLNIGTTLRKYGACLTGLRRYEEAESALLEAHEILLAAVGENHRHTQGVIRNLIALYDAWGKRDRAERWRAALARA